MREIPFRFAMAGIIEAQEGAALAFRQRVEKFPLEPRMLERKPPSQNRPGKAFSPVFRRRGRRQRGEAGFPGTVRKNVGGLAFGQFGDSVWAWVR